jgi:hypothetical protein
MTPSEHAGELPDWMLEDVDSLRMRATSASGEAPRPVPSVPAWPRPNPPVPSERIVGAKRIYELVGRKICQHHGPLRRCSATSAGSDRPSICRRAIRRVGDVEHKLASGRGMHYARGPKPMRRGEG